jgi:DNA polymerase bacteriophage-type
MTNICFFDWETRSLSDLPTTGTLRYVLDPSTQPLLLSWAIDDDPVKLWCPDLQPELVPEVWAYVEGRMTDVGARPMRLGVLLQQPDGYVCAWNCAFDRQVWQQIATPDYGFPELKIEQTLDAMCQGLASNLPGSLDFAGRALGLGTKTVGGKAIMKRFADAAQPLPGSPADIEALMAKGLSRARAIEVAIESWVLYLDYSVQDTELLRDVWKCTRPLDATEWAEYWVSERINDRGMLADLDVCRGAAAYHEEEAAYVVEQVKELTQGQIAGPTFTAQINNWVYDRLPDDLAELMVKKRDEEGYVTNLTGDKNIMTRLLEEIQTSDTPPADEVIDLLEVLQYGRSSSALKFQKILNQEVDGRLGGSYIFNGAGQTGRFSSRGVQVHNLPRAHLKNELDVLDMIAGGLPIEDLRKIGPVSSVLAKLIRPTFIAPEGKLLVWGDWSAIEARVTPWLAATRDAEEAVLAPFRESDADPDMPDVYILNAAQVFKIDPRVLWERYKNGDPEAKAMRQAGKVMVLSLGFRGSVGALKAMAKNYGIRLSNEEAKTWVDGWRDRNRWNKRFGVKCEEAAFTAVRQPGSMQRAGRLSYQFAPGLMGGTLICFLPDGRPIVYPKAKIAKVEKFGKEQDAITYLNGMGRRGLWDGLQIENGTQATAASILRQTLVRLEAEEPTAETVLHTHDEVGAEVDDTIASGFAERLESVMVRGFDWTGGLPLAAEVTTDWYYHK